MSVSVNLHFNHCNVLIIGGGHVAFRKAKQMQKEGANITIITKELKDGCFKELPCTILKRAFRKEDITQDFDLVYAATDDIEVNRQIIEIAKSMHILCGCSNQNVGATFTSMAQVEKQTYQIAISSKCPAIHNQLLQEIDLHPHIQRKLELLQQARSFLCKQEINMDSSKILQTLYMYDVNVLETIFSKSNEAIIILAYHGVAMVSNIQTELKQMHLLVQNTFHKYGVIEAFVSKKIQGKAQQKGFQVPYIFDLINILQLFQISYYLQPMLIQEGKYYYELKNSIQVSMLGNVLLQNQEDVFYLQKKIESIYGEKWIGIYHDSSFANLLNYSQKMVGIHVDFESFIQDNQTIVPIILLYGYHMEKDLNRQVDFLRLKGYHVDLQARSLLSYSWIQEWFLEKIKFLIHTK